MKKDELRNELTNEFSPETISSLEALSIVGGNANTKSPDVQTWACVEYYCGPQKIAVATFKIKCANKF